MDISKLMQEANKAKLHPSQKAFAIAAKEFVHDGQPIQPKKKKKKIPVGRKRRHDYQKAKGVKTGFGKSIPDDFVTFRVELNWHDKETEEEFNEQVHWVECKKFRGHIYKDYKKFFEENDKFEPGQTVESKFVTRYICNWLLLNREKRHLNQAFIFPSSNKRDDNIRDLLCQILWTGELNNYEVDPDFAVVLKKSIYHDEGKIVV